MYCSFLQIIRKQHKNIENNNEKLGNFQENQIKMDAYTLDQKETVGISNEETRLEEFDKIYSGWGGGQSCSYANPIRVDSFC